ncbi:hypothetical protein [Luteolibacter luteus]|uniref:Uncharacterized protein n=1 Tax=Luteolibacter luteus TaxID=2728835 RepID=A0A858RF74_9BACT|nr:hypothetical protein [Luteolibacter luteus]QJE95214.1 hypothetical protein HHL09_05305 [Luteolibacter luteus]
MPSAVVRLLCESRDASRTVRDATTEQRPFYWRGSSVKFQLALADGGAFLLAADVGEIIVEVKKLTALALDDSLMRKTFVAGDCDDTFTSGNWGGGSKQLLEASFTVNEAAILPGTYRLIVRHVATDGQENVYLSSELQVIDPQSGSEGIDPPPVAWTYLDSVPVVMTIPQALNGPQRQQVLANLGLEGLVVDLEANTQRGGLAADPDGIMHVVGWNFDQGRYQGIGIDGAPGNEKLFVYDLPT